MNTVICNNKREYLASLSSLFSQGFDWSLHHRGFQEPKKMLKISEQDYPIKLFVENKSIFWVPV